MPDGRALLIAVKASAGPGRGLCLPVGEPVIALLRPVATAGGRLAPGDVGRLTRWRNRHPRAFLTEFEATKERTARWLRDIVGPGEDRILFMIDDLHGRAFGYMGLAFIDWVAGSAEVDAFVRGEPDVPGGMTAGLRALRSWAATALGLPQLGVRVLSDNRAVAFYRAFGFVEHRRVPLRRCQEAERVVWAEDPDATSGRCLVHMRLPC